MKVKTGFISNSSSSSFIIGCKEKPTKELLLDVFKVSEESPLYSFAEEIIDFIISDIKEEKEYEDFNTDLEKEIFDKGWKVFKGYVSSDGNSYAKDALCCMSFYYKDDNMIIEKNEGY